MIELDPDQFFNRQEPVASLLRARAMITEPDELEAIDAILRLIKARMAKDSKLRGLMLADQAALLQEQAAVEGLSQEEAYRIKARLLEIIKQMNNLV